MRPFIIRAKGSNFAFFQKIIQINVGADLDLTSAHRNSNIVSRSFSIIAVYYPYINSYYISAKYYFMNFSLVNKNIGSKFSSGALALVGQSATEKPYLPRQYTSLDKTDEYQSPFPWRWLFILALWFFGAYVTGSGIWIYVYHHALFRGAIIAFLGVVILLSWAGLIFGGFLR